MAGRAVTVLPIKDILDGGGLSISGIITENNTPGQYRVRLHDQLTGRPIRETWSSSNGSYSFTLLDNKTRYVVAFDHTSPVQYAAIQDNVIASA